MLHLPFDTDSKDTSAGQHNGTNVGNVTYVQGIIGVGAASVFTQTNTPYSTNFVTLGAMTNFGIYTNSFTVWYWVKLPNAQSELYYGLPFFANVSGVYAQGGFYFGPGINDLTFSGGWEWEIGTVGNTPANPNVNTINDGNWHHLLYSVNRSGSCNTYLDGVNVDSTPIFESTGDLFTGNPVNIGQDSSGKLAVNGAYYIDDLAVWTRALSSLEVSEIYLSGQYSTRVRALRRFRPAPHAGGPYLTRMANGSIATQLDQCLDRSLPAPCRPRAPSKAATPTFRTAPRRTPSGRHNAAMFYRLNY